MELACETLVGMVVSEFVSSRGGPARESAGVLRIRKGMFLPSVGVDGLEESNATSFSNVGITISLSEKALMEEIGRASAEREPFAPAAGNKVLDVCASFPSSFVELATLLVYPGIGLRILNG